MTEQNVAVLIDYENVGSEVLPGLFDLMADVGRVIVKRAYADWSKVKPEAKGTLLELGIEAIQNFHAAASSKNSSDIRLAIDAVELLHTSPVDVYVIVSADSDFVSLVGKLRAKGKVVIGAGKQEVVSPTLVRSCDRYIFLDSTESDGKRPTRISSTVIPKSAEELVHRALRASSDEDGKVVGAKLHQSMLRIDPSFDFKSLGFRSFTQFLSSCQAIKLSRPKGPGDVVVELS